MKTPTSSRLCRNYTNIWRDIYVCIGLRQGLSTESLRFCAKLISQTPQSRPLGEAQAVSELRSHAGTAQGILKVAHLLLSVTQACNKVYANPRQLAVTRIARIARNFGANSTSHQVWSGASQRPLWRRVNNTRHVAPDAGICRACGAI